MLPRSFETRVQAVQSPDTTVSTANGDFPVVLAFFYPHCAPLVVFCLDCVPVKCFPASFWQGKGLHTNLEIYSLTLTLIPRSCFVLLPVSRLLLAVKPL